MTEGLKNRPPWRSNKGFTVYDRIPNILFRFWRLTFTWSSCKDYPTITDRLSRYSNDFSSGYIIIKLVLAREHPIAVPQPLPRQRPLWGSGPRRQAAAILRQPLSSSTAWQLWSSRAPTFLAEPTPSAQFSRPVERERYDAHRALSLSNIELAKAYFPPKVTSKLQPLDQGVFHKGALLKENVNPGGPTLQSIHRMKPLSLPLHPLFRSLMSVTVDCSFGGTDQTKYDHELLCSRWTCTETSENELLAAVANSA